MQKEDIDFIKKNWKQIAMIFVVSIFIYLGGLLLGTTMSVFFHYYGVTSAQQRCQTYYLYDYLK
jgi:hypothetical protein